MTNDVVRPQASGVNHLGLSVTDLERSVAFYREVLGAILLRPPFDGERGFAGRMAILMLDVTTLDLFEHAANDGMPFEPARTGLDHLALSAVSYDELDAWARWIDAQGIARSEVRDSGGFGAQFDFLDPDGIQIEFCFLDEAKVREATAPLRS